MRYPVPDNKKVYVRFHKELDKMIEEKAEKENKKSATLVAQILTSFIKEPFPLSPSSYLFFLRRGRGRESNLGKGMNITMKKVIWNEIRIRGEKEGMKEGEMRSAILFSFFEREEEEKKK